MSCHCQVSLSLSGAYAVFLPKFRRRAMYLCFHRWCLYFGTAVAAVNQCTPNLSCELQLEVRTFICLQACICQAGPVTCGASVWGWTKLCGNVGSRQGLYCIIAWRRFSGDGVACLFCSEVSCVRCKAPLVLAMTKCLKYPGKLWHL
jgi:hypothetical protein